jgi:cbb3-type cytochrome oxidase subunit 3
MTTHAMFLLYVSIGLLASVVILIRDANNHINEWKHSSIDLPDDLQEKSSKLLFWKIINKVISLIFQILLYTILWPVILVLYIRAKLKSPKQNAEFQETKYFEE